MSPHHPAGLDVSQMSRSLNESYSFKPVGPDKITCTQRIWDGIDKPDYTPVFSGSIPEARSWVSQITAAIEECEAQALKSEARRRTELVKSIADLQSELTGLDRLAARRAEVDAPQELAAQAEERGTVDHGC